jgi:hypothetical protein
MKRDVSIGITASILVGTAALLLAHTLDARFFDPPTGNDVWFEADLGRIADEMTRREAAQERSNLHPLFPLMTVPPTYALSVLGVGAKGSVVAVIGLSAAVWAASFWVLVRSLGTQRSDAVVMLLLATISAAGQFWLAVPETAALASASVMCAVAVGVYAAKRPLDEKWLIAVSVGSLAVTVSNWIAGLAAAVAALPPRRALQVSVNAFAIVVALWAVQRTITPHTKFLVGYRAEQRYLLRPEAGGPFTALRAVTLSGMVMPRLGTVHKNRRGQILTVQRPSLRTQTLLWYMATLLWCGLVVAGLVAALRARLAGGYGLLAFVTACLLGLYAVYGTESFLYTLSVVPLLVALVSAALQTRYVWWLRIGLATLLILAGINNAKRLGEARLCLAASSASTFTPTSVPSSAPLPCGHRFVVPHEDAT